MADKKEILKKNGYGKALERNDPREIAYCIKNLIIKYKGLIRTADTFDEEDLKELEYLKHDLSILEAI
ncbi:hypothetical protein LCGC14_1588590 [marine sediment metagenome]|uniref:Uncharacterized protein n=1 Tax=marine sediment metagenome TaxID=412755 RepID=A0A0F9J0Z1_9ZZZZ